MKNIPIAFNALIKSRYILVILLFIFSVSGVTAQADGKTPSAPAKKIITSGLLVDLNADLGFDLNDSNQVIKWHNQASFPEVPYFEKNDKGRNGVCEGCPSVKRDLPQINGHNSIVFREDELLNHDEDAFDHLTTGSGYTFFAIMSIYKQTGKLKDVNSFFGNLRNGGKYEGFWAGLTDDNDLWVGSRNGVTFGRWDPNNPFIPVGKPLQENRYYLIMGKMDAGTDTVNISIFINNADWPVKTGRYPVNTQGNPSKLSIGQERDAVEHPGVESFDGEISRFLLYDRALGKKEMTAMARAMVNQYHISDK